MSYLKSNRGAGQLLDLGAWATVDRFNGPKPFVGKYLQTLSRTGRCESIGCFVEKTTVKSS